MIKVFFVSEKHVLANVMAKISEAMGFGNVQAASLEEAEEKIFAGDFTHVVVMGDFHDERAWGTRTTARLTQNLRLWRKSAMVLKTGLESRPNDPDYLRLPFRLEEFRAWIEAH